MRCFSLTGSDDRMDCREMFSDPLNALPPKCGKCGFPDLDHVPQPYSLVKSRTLSPNELAPAENGNFFVRERVHRILEQVAPGQCRFYPTSNKGTAEETPWLLAVPTHQVVTAKVDPSIPRCQTCGEPRSAHPGSQYSEWIWDRQSQYDVLKAATWGSSEFHWSRWIDRDLFMSVRLFHLLKGLKAKGLYEATCGKLTSPDKEEAAWIQERLHYLKGLGVPLHPAGMLSDEDARWYRGYLKRHGKETVSALDIKPIERRFKFKLPRSYVEFITQVGPVKFENVDEQEGFTVQILLPEEFDVQEYRAGALQADDQESNSVDGVMFARTEHGDCFCFDVRKDRKEFPVFVYKHEYNAFEPYADSFAASVRRFAGG